MTGGTMSVTSTRLTRVAVLPALSVAVQVTLVDPRLNDDPEAGTHEEEAMPEPSVAVRVQETTAVAVMPLDGLAVSGLANEKLGLNARVGRTVSVLLTMNSQVVTLSALSVTEQRTAVMPMPAMMGDETLQDGPDLIPDASEAVGVVYGKVTTAVVPEVGVTDVEDGQISSGGWLSTIVRGNEQEVVRSALSVTVQPTVVVVPTR